MIRIAVVSSKAFAKEILKFEKEIPNIKFMKYIYENPLESPLIVDKIHDCDVVLFAGPLPYFFSKKVVEKKNWPSVFIPSDEYTLTHTLLYLLLNRKEGLQGLSIDIHRKTYLHHVAQEMNIDVSDWNVLDAEETLNEDRVEFDPESIIKFHQELWESGKITYAVTNVDYVHSRLEKLGIPSTYLIVPAKAIIDTIRQAVMYGKLSISKNLELAVGIISLTSSGEEFEIDEERAALAEEILTKLAKKLESSIRKNIPGQFVIYGTIGSMELFLFSERLQNLLNRFDDIGDLIVHIGYGAGMTAKEAEENAQTALFYAQRKSLKHSVFFMNAEKKIIGPMNDLAKTFQLKTEDKQILQMTDKMHLSVSTVTKLREFSKIRRDEGFTTIQLAEYLEISRRSAERLMKKLIDDGYTHRVGEEQPPSRGRPRAVYRMDFN